MKYFKWPKIVRSLPFLLGIYGMLALSACSSTVPIDTLNLTQLQHLSANTVHRSDEGLSEIRESVLRETALSMGARSGLAYRSREIDAMLDGESKNLERSFNFNAQLLAHNVLPPVLVEGRGDLNLADQDTIRLADRTYKIVQQAQFVTTAPTWRTYLWMGFTRPDPPDKSLLPKNPHENAVWSQYIAEGWQQGIVQANEIYTDNLNRLQRDYNGILLYRKMLMENMVSPPFVAATNLGVTNDNGEMRVNDQVLRITVLPQLQANATVWNPVMVNTWRPPTLPINTDSTNTAHE